MQKPVFRLILAAMLSSCAMPQAVADAPRPATVAATTEDERLMALFAADQNREQALDPLGTLFRTGRSDPALLRQLFTDNPVRALRASVAQSLAELKLIDRARLSADRQISYDVFAYSKQDEAHWLRPEMVALTAVLPLEHFGGLHVQFPSMMAKGGVASFDSVDDYDAALALDRAYPQILDNAVARFRDGLSSGVVASRMTVSNMIAQLDAQLAQPAEESPFYTPVLDFPASVPEADRTRLRTAYRAAIA
ncbi:MAG TPA: DUF885 family protein, partial [Novosphingobium sp.]|nr:DUF885 family protein [Novosphingobium sp.]